MSNGGSMHASGCDMSLFIARVIYRLANRRGVLLHFHTKRHLRKALALSSCFFSSLPPSLPAVLQVLLRNRLSGVFQPSHTYSRVAHIQWSHNLNLSGPWVVPSIKIRSVGLCKHRLN